jgi:signal transduction histidine kinase
MTAKLNVTDIEIANMRNNLNLIRSQLKAGRLDEMFLSMQVNKMDNLLERLAQDRTEQSQSSRFEALYNVSRVLGSSLELQTVLDQVMDAIIQLTKAERGFLMLNDDDGGLTVKVARNFDQQTLSSDDFRFSSTVVNRVLDSGEAILTTNASEDPRFAGQASIVSQSLRSIMATPLRARGNVIGVVYVDSRALAGLFNNDDLNALDAFSAQAAIAVDNALLFSATDEALNRRVEELRQLRRVDMKLNETLDIDKAVSFTLEAACRLVNAQRGLLGLVGGDEEHPHIANMHQFGYEPNDTPTTTIEVLYPQAVDVVHSGHFVIGDTHIIVPIKRDNVVIGVVVLRNDERGFTEDQADLVERVVTRASVAIENGQLYAAVQAADRAKSEFVGVVAHDLKAPMTGIKGYAELLLMLGDLDDSQINYLQKISATVDRMEMLVSDLADISRIESGHFFMDVTYFAIEDVIQAVKDGTMPQIKSRDHQLIEKIEANLPPIYTDYYRLLQVLTNLVSNAYKYTPNGGTITLEAYRMGDKVEFRVSDSGIGMSREQVAMLGTKFWRADDDYTRAQSGTGLGFSITRSLIEQMGDKIKIDSQQGKGSSFTFRVPLAVDGIFADGDGLG